MGLIQFVSILGARDESKLLFFQDITTGILANNFTFSNSVCPVSAETEQKRGSAKSTWFHNFLDVRNVTYATE